jgi:hypothetical protein
MVKNLNANFVGGLNATNLKSSGGDDFTRVDASLMIPALASVIAAETGKLAAGTYYVSATAMFSLAAGNTGGICQIIRANNMNHALSEGGANGSGFVEAAETVAVKVKNNERLAEKCFVQGTGGNSTIFDAGITAIRRPHLRRAEAQRCRQLP